MTYNEATALLFLADRSTCPEPGQVCDWARPPRLDADVLPVARAFRDASARADTTGAFGLAGALDLVLARASDPSGRTRPPFRVLETLASGEDRLVPVGEHLRRHPRPDLPGLERRLGWLTDGPLGHHAGDVALLARAGDARPIEERFYFGSPRASGHGSAATSDAVIPLLVARPSATGEALRAEVTAAVGERPTQLDIADLILAILGQ